MHERAAMPHAVIAANHASSLDGLLLGAFLPGRPSSHARDGAHRQHVFDALLEAKRAHGRGHVIADDLDQNPMTYGGLITAS